MITRFNIFEDRGYYNEKPIEGENYDDFKDDVEKVFENDNWLVIKPKSFEAFCYYAQDQEWSDAKYGRKYNFNPNIYLNINKKDDSRIVLNFSRGDFYGEDDEKIYLKDFLEENQDLFTLYGEVLDCSDIVKEGDNYWIIVDDYEYFAPYFKVDRNTNEKFIKSVLSGEGFEFFDYSYRDFDINEPYLEVDEDNLLLLKIVLMLEKQNNDDYDYEIDEIEDYKDICRIIKRYDIEELENSLKMSISRAHSDADDSAAYEDLTNEVYSFFNLEMGSAKWQNYQKDNKLWIRFKSKSDAYNAKFIINKYDDSYEDDVIEYSSPYYGYRGKLEEIQEIFDNEIPDRLWDYDNDDINGKRINKYFKTWKKIEKENPNFSDDEMMKEIEILLDAEKYNL